MIETSEIRIDEDGTETHESWITIRANHVTSTPGAWLFDSEIPHQHYIVVTASRTERRRDLHRDWLHNTKVLFEIAMSAAQWGAFVSSFGQGGGVPATLHYLGGHGMVPQAPPESRLAVSHKEVKEAGREAVADIQAARDALEAAFARKAGRREMGELLNTLHYAIEHVPGNMEFAAKSLTEHSENVVTKAQADIEAMVAHAIDQGTLDSGFIPQLQIGMGDSNE